jgi:predicted ATPase/signal transduction histidine kinase
VSESSPFVVHQTLHRSDRTTLYRALSRQDSKAVILKALDANYVPSQDGDRLENEYKLGPILQGLPALQPLYLSSFQRRPALVFQDFEGAVSLESRIGNAMPLDEFLPLATRMASALADIHARNLIHKNLKPASFLFNPESGEIKICDFGIASLLPYEQTAIRPLRLIEGSFPYMSPEQTGRMNRALDSRSDLYSLGITFYEMLTGHLPFEASDVVGWVYNHVARLPTPLTEIQSSMPQLISDLILKLLAKVPEDRYQSASGLRRDLERCLKEWRETKRIRPFPLGQHDTAHLFFLSQKVYGREKEISLILKTFDQVAATGNSQLMLISGPPGVGKSTLIRELQRPLIDRHGFFLSGKCDLLRRDVPYAAVVEACRELILDILARSEKELAFWRRKIAAALGSRGQLIVELIPQLELLLGPQPPVPELPLRETEHRLQFNLSKFLAVFAERDSPLTLFLDDLQWADSSTLKLLVSLAQDPSMHYFFLIGAYRNNEVSPSHPLRLAIDLIQQSHPMISDISLSPLSEADTNELLADTFHCSPEHTKSLTRLIHEKTAGNPFFMVQLLMTLVQQNQIFFDSKDEIWKWEIQRIEALEHSDNVVDWMVEKLKRLPRDSQEALMVGACLGDQFDVETLHFSLQFDPQPLLKIALEEGLLFQFDSTYRFRHDRVRDAAYSLIPSQHRSQFHLRVGRQLAARLKAPEMSNRLFEIANQFNQGIALISEPSERLQVAEINLRAGKKAKMSGASLSACFYLSSGMALLDDSYWEDHYRLIYDLHLERAYCELVLGHFGEVESLIKTLLQRARSNIDQADVYSLQIMVHVIKSENPEAVSCGLKALRLFGLEIPIQPAPEEVIAEEEKFWRNLGDRTVESLIHLPLMTNPEAKALLKIFSALGPPVGYTNNIHLGNLLICHMANISLQYGISGYSAISFAFFGSGFVQSLHRYSEAYQFNLLACNLVEKYGFLAEKAQVYFLMEVTALWCQPIAKAMEFIQESFRTAVEVGDLAVTCYSSYHILTDIVLQGSPLELAWRESEKALDIASKTGFRDMADIIRVEQRLIETLQGRTASFSSFDGDQFDEKSFEAQLTSGRMNTMIGLYWVIKTQARFLAGDLSGAWEASQKVNDFLWSVGGHIQILDYHLYTALTLAGLFETASAEQRPHWLGLLAEHQNQLRLCAENYPPTFYDKYALVSAEIARLENKDIEALHWFEKAIECARNNGFIQNEALAHELAARFNLTCGFTTASAGHLQEAHQCYTRWGATAKVRQLEQQHPELIERAKTARDMTLALHTEHLDLLSVTKASQSISEEIDLDRLIRRLIQVVIEFSGAQKGAILLSRSTNAEDPDSRELELVAQAQLSKRQIEVRMEREPNSIKWQLPLSILNFVRRTHETVNLISEIDFHRFSADEYLSQETPKSVLCMPIIRQTELVGLLYLENKLLPNTFISERLLTLELLAAQAAISIENALLMRQEKAAHAAADAANRAKSQFLANMSHEIRTPLAVILGFAEILTDPGLSSLERQQWGDRIKQNGIHLQEIINSILDLGKVEAGELQISITSFPVSAIIDDIYETWGTIAKQKGLSFQVRVEGSLPQIIHSDLTKFKQILINIIGNSLKFTEQGHIDVTFKMTPERKLAVLVHDTGPGLTEAEAEKIFQAFVQLDMSDTRKFGGTGLGLTLARALARALGGDVTLKESRKNLGSTFEITIDPGDLV